MARLKEARVLASIAAAGVLLSAVTAPGAAAESSKLRDDVTAMVMIMDGPRDKDCAERKISDTQVLEVRPDGTGIVERWTLNRCGKSINYLVRFTRNAKGGTDFDVQLEK
jgi:hypothetical protein